MTVGAGWILCWVASLTRGDTKPSLESITHPPEQEERTRTQIFWRQQKAQCPSTVLELSVMVPENGAIAIGAAF